MYVLGVVTVHKIHGSVRYDTMVSRFATFFDTGGGGNWLRRNVGNISVLNHEGKPMDYQTNTRLHQDLHAFELCARCMPVNVLISVNSL